MLNVLMLLVTMPKFVKLQNRQHRNRKKMRIKKSFPKKNPWQKLLKNENFYYSLILLLNLNHFLLNGSVHFYLF